MHRINLNLDPFVGPLFCPFCGAQSINENDAGECDHLVYANVGVDPDDED